MVEKPGLVARIARPSIRAPPTISRSPPVLGRLPSARSSALTAERAAPRLPVREHSLPASTTRLAQAGDDAAPRAGNHSGGGWHDILKQPLMTSGARYLMASISHESEQSEQACGKEGVHWMRVGVTRPAGEEGLERWRGEGGGRLDRADTRGRVTQRCRTGRARKERKREGDDGKAGSRPS